jgi:hypothetical protein
MLSGWSIGASIRLPTNILESNGSAPDLSHWIFFLVALWLCIFTHLIYHRVILSLV